MKNNITSICDYNGRGDSLMFTQIVKDIHKERSTITPREAAERIFEKSSKEIPVKIVGITQKMAIEVLVADSLPNDDSGIIGIDKRLESRFSSDKVVVLNKNMKPGKQRFVLAHEIGHYLLEFDGDSKKTYYNNYNRSNITEIEKKANEFAACLLMPESQFVENYNTLVGNRNSFYEITKELCKRFGVTEKSILKRFDELGLSYDRE